MAVVIIGAGTIGSSIAEFLLNAGRDVIVIDLDRERLDRLENMLDIQAVQGDGCDPATLLQAQVQRSELLLALTQRDEVNLLSAMAGKRLGARRTVARLRAEHFLSADHFDYRAALDIDLTLSPEVLTAAEIVKYLDNPDALALEFYAQGKVQLLQFELEPGHAFAGPRIRDLKLPQHVLIVLVSRGEQVLIPNGDQTLLAGDKITLLGKSGTLSGMRGLTGRQSDPIQSIVIAGGGETGALLAAALEQKIPSVRLLEIDLQRCRRLGHNLTKTHILHGDATDRAFLTQERIGRADVFIAAMHSDEDNIMTSLLVKKMGVARCVAVIKRPDYTPLLVENTAIDLALSPREVMATRVLTLIKRGFIHSISMLENGKAEVIEFTARANSPLLNRPLKDLTFPTGSLVGIIGRGNSIRIPRGNDQIREGDTVIMVTLANVAGEVEELF